MARSPAAFWLIRTEGNTANSCAIRSEALAIPKLLVAPAPPVPFGVSTSKHDRADLRGYYEDGAYIAREHRPIGPALLPTDVSLGLEVQQAYHTALLKKYNNLRAQLEQITGAKLIERIESDPTFDYKEVPTSRHGWLDSLDRVPPTPAQVAQLSTKDIFRALELCTKNLSRAGAISKARAYWIWCLLGKVREYGTLDNSQVGIIRQLAKKSASLGTKLRGAPVPAFELHQVESESDNESVVDWDMNMSDDDGKVAEDPTKVQTGAEQAPSDILEAAKARLLAQVDDMEMTEAASDDNTIDALQAAVLAQLGDRLVKPTLLSRDEAEQQRQQLRKQELGEHIEEDAPAKNVEPEDDAVMHTKATIDMILTIAGECFGQRDLLSYREVWGK